jgi:hypothetical protein
MESNYGYGTAGGVAQGSFGTILVRSINQDSVGDAALYFLAKVDIIICEISIPIF